MPRLSSCTFALAFAALLLAGRFVGIAGAAVMIGGIIFLHELGHFLAAKRMGMPVEVFSLGFGPRLLGFRWKETDVRLSALPLGGYVKLAGYNPEEPDAEDPYGFLKQPARKRLFFYAGGVLANLLSVFVLLTVMEMDRGRSTFRPAPSPLRVDQVFPGTPAEAAGMKENDLIRRLGELRFPGATSTETVAYIQARPGQPLEVELERDGKPLRLVLTPAGDQGRGRVGIQFGATAFHVERAPLRLTRLPHALAAGAGGTWELGVQVLAGFKRLVSFQASLKEVGGPITIARAGSQAAQAGLAYYLWFAAFISMNLAVLNALPIPFLDGGHIAILLVEKLRRKELPVVLKERILMGGLVFLASLMAFVVVLDLLKLRH